MSNTSAVLDRTDAIGILRKAGESRESDIAWQAVAEMSDEEWTAILGFLVDGLKSMGVVLCDEHLATA